VDLIDLPKRTQKPRQYGITAIIDLGVTVAELQNILKDYHDYIDIAKFGIGSAYITPNLTEKLKVYREFGITICFGGTLFEKFYHQKKIEVYLEYLKRYQVEMIEISTGAIDIPIEERLDLVKKLKNDFVVASEVGCKDVDRIMPPSQWISEIEALLKAGSRYVITEGRESGTAGLFRSSGEIRTGLVADIIKAVDPKKLIFEAPTAKSQMYFINLLGPNVNLGNIPLNNLLVLEAQRCGLRYETFFMKT
jgi:phosphosulfolactate synthase